MDLPRALKILNDHDHDREGVLELMEQLHYDNVLFSHLWWAIDTNLVEGFKLDSIASAGAQRSRQIKQEQGADASSYWSLHHGAIVESCFLFAWWCYKRHILEYNGVEVLEHATRNFPEAGFVSRWARWLLENSDSISPENVSVCLNEDGLAFLDVEEGPLAQQVDNLLRMIFKE